MKTAIQVALALLFAATVWGSGYSGGSGGAAGPGTGDIDSVFDCVTGACSDVTVPNGGILDTSGTGTITATSAATATTATTAGAGDSATSFFPSGTLERAIGGTGVDMTLTGGTGHVLKQTSLNGAVVSGLLVTNNYTSASVDAAALGVDSVSASELNATGVEAELEAVQDLQDFQGAVTDGQVPDTITIAAAGGNVALAGAVSKCARFDASGILVAAGSDCGAGGAGDVESVFDCASGACTAILVDTGQTLGVSGTGTITATDTVCTGCLSDTELAADSVSASELNATGVEAELEAVLDLNELQGTITDLQIANDAVDGGTGGEIADNTINVDDLAPNSVSSSELDGAGVESELEALLDLDQIQGTISDTQIAAGAVDGGNAGEIADASVTFDDLAADSVAASELADAAIDEVAGALDGTGLLVDTSTTPDEIDILTTEITGARTWGDGTDASIAWTWNLSGAYDPPITFASDNLVTLTDTQNLILEPIQSGFRVTGTIDYDDPAGSVSIYAIPSFLANRTFTCDDAPGCLYPDSFLDTTAVVYSGTDNITTANNQYQPYSFVSTQRYATTSTGDYAHADAFAMFHRPTIDSGNVGGPLTFEGMGGMISRMPVRTSGATDEAADTVADYSLVFADWDETGTNPDRSKGNGIVLTNAYGVKLEDFDDATTNYTLWSDSISAGMRHAGVATFGVGTTHPEVDYFNVVVDGDWDADDLAAAAGTGILNFGYQWQPNVHIGQAQSLLGAVGAMTSSGAVIEHDDASWTAGNNNSIHLFYAAHTIDNTVSEDVNPTSTAVTDAQLYRFNGAITSTGGILRSFNSSPVISAISGATATVTEATGFRWAPRTGTDNGASDGTAITITTVTGLSILNATADAGGGTETTTTQIGVDIASLDGPGTSTDIGIRNADTTVNTPTTQVIAAVSTAVVPTASTICIDVDSGPIDLTVDPQISDGVVGQELLVVNCDADSDEGTIEFDDATGLQLYLSVLGCCSATGCILGPGDSMRFTYLTVDGVTDWWQTGYCMDTSE